MIVKIRLKEVRVRRQSSEQYQGEDKFTGAVTYSVIGSVDHKPVRLSLGTKDLRIATRRIEKLKLACAVGAISTAWAELEALPVSTFNFFASKVGYLRSAEKAPTELTWAGLVAAFELEMQSLIDKKMRSANTLDRYRQTFRHFAAHLKSDKAYLSDITPATVELFKVARHRSIKELKQSRGGSSIALDIAVLHRVFKFAVKKQLMDSNPIDLANENKPGKNPENGARPFTADELTALRKHAGQDTFMLLLLLQTGLRGSDAVSLRWENVHFETGVNGEIQVLTMKRGKVATIPMVSELHNALVEVAQARYGGKIPKDDYVLYNPETSKPFMNADRDVEAARKRLYTRVVALGERAKVNATPHDFRDTFACDALAKRVDIYSLAKMLADTVDTIETHYASFIPAARDAAQNLLETGIGIEEQARIAKTRGRKVTAIRA
jgi:integrase